MADMIAKSLIVACILLLLTVVVALTRKYIATRDIGFIWLGVAFAWPMVSGALHSVFPSGSTFAGYSAGTSYTLLSMTLRVIELALQLVAVFYLYKNKIHPVISRDLPPNPAG